QRLVASVLESRKELLLPLAEDAPDSSQPDVLAPLVDAQGNLFGVALHFGGDTAARSSNLRSRALAACELALEQTPFGVVVLDAAMRVVHANARAQALITAGTAVMLQDGHLQAVDAPTHERLRQHVQAASDAAGSEYAELLELGRGTREAAVIGVITSGAGVHSFEAQPLVVLFLFDLGHRQTLSATVLQRVFGLTRSESRLVQTLVGGCSLEDGAQALGISVNTARTHLKHIFHKTGARRQSELIHQVETGPASLTLGILHRRK
ncbi:MAG: helix-turn-helix transcriptional regulator, partial [Gammaproteobacteria bacterium]